MARICCHGSQQQWGVNFYETYAPVVRQDPVIIIMITSNLYHLNTRSINVVLAYPQAAIKTNIYIFPPAGVITDIEGKDL
eukprot:3038121-Ditylum_brightwellii.AAC.1